MLTITARSRHTSAARVLARWPVRSLMQPDDFDDETPTPVVPPETLHETVYGSRPVGPTHPTASMRPLRRPPAEAGS